MPDFRELLADGRPHLFDGAMGTMLYGKGVYINRCYDELCISQPDLVADVHRAYCKAGAEILETNTYGANRAKLARYGLEERTAEINACAAGLARRAAGERVFVAGAIGPLGMRIEPFGPTSAGEARSIFREQAEGSPRAGSTFSSWRRSRPGGDPPGILAGARGVRPSRGGAHDDPRGRAHPLWHRGRHAGERLAGWGAEVWGSTAAWAPAPCWPPPTRCWRPPGGPLIMQPNAGLPRDVDGRTIYMASPEYMATYTARLIRKGVRFVGGCCGTTPDHIARMAGALRMLAPAQSTRVHAAPHEPDSRATEPVPLAERSQWGRKLAAGEFLTTVEIVPPRGVNPAAMLDGVRLLRAAGVDGVNVPDGPRAQSRMGALATALLIQQQVGMEAVVHYSCRDRNLLGMLSDLLGAQALGLRNMLFITGDPPKMGPYPDATAVFDIDAIGLTNLAARLNRGLDPGGNVLGDATSFVLGVGVNPGAEDLEHELRRFYWKVEAGAEYAITQPVFDLRQLESFVARIEKEGIRIPIIAGIWPLVSARNAEFLANEVPGVVVPPEVMERMRRASDLGKEAAVEEGTLIAQEMLRDSLPIIQGVQVSAPFGRVPLALRVFEAIPGWRGAEEALAVSA
jgi:homocysteine S-methyltransferase